MSEKQFEFWSTQPVPKLDEVSTSSEPIEQDIPLDDLRKQPFSLPPGFHWDTLKINDPIVVRNVPSIFSAGYNVRMW